MVLHFFSRCEIRNSIANGTYSTMWHLHGLSSVLGCRVRSIYPEHGLGLIVRDLQNRIIEPRVPRISGMLTLLVANELVFTEFLMNNPKFMLYLKNLFLLVVSDSPEGMGHF